MASTPFSVLIVDNDPIVIRMLADWLGDQGHRVDSTPSVKDALRQAARQIYDLAIVDLALCFGDGRELQEHLLSTQSDLTLVVMAERSAIEAAVRALKAGAYDYITKPLDPEELAQMVNRVTEHRSLRCENRRLRARLEAVSTPDFIVGSSHSMKRLLELVDAVVDTDATVLIKGEWGTGRELIARFIHAHSGRRYGPLVIVNCGALAEPALEEELFGQDATGPEGMSPHHEGKLQLADGGTIFLDEIASLSARTQARLLLSLETTEVARTGGQKPTRVDFRVIAATTRDLETLVDKGEFRKDLFWRLNVVTLEIPPLRRRPEDIPVLAEHFLSVLAREMNRKALQLSPEAVEALQQHSWPGNVRELRNAIEKAVMVGTPPTIVVEDLPLRLTIPAIGPGPLPLAEVERAHISRVLKACRWNISRAAKLLEVDRGTLYNKIAKYGFKRSA
ncbi:MAG: sigma-54-dependent Fis family transcriptional regulator [Acidobacteria bacterium]|nr:MAG: sigma-54-dependent Fis family transcriptional regulator [Acidobacteriota bacterium]